MDSGLWQSGKRVCCALDGGVLVTAAIGQLLYGIGDNDFASVLRTHSACVHLIGQKVALTALC
jgi:hypothetical protein